jgi:hypothetical protein
MHLQRKRNEFPTAALTVTESVLSGPGAGEAFSGTNVDDPSAGTLLGARYVRHEDTNAATDARISGDGQA